MATHSSILAWKSSWTEEPGGLQSMSPGQNSSNERAFTAQILKFLTQHLEGK